MRRSTLFAAIGQRSSSNYPSHTTDVGNDSPSDRGKGTLRIAFTRVWNMFRYRMYSALSTNTYQKILNLWYLRILPLCILMLCILPYPQSSLAQKFIEELPDISL